MAIIKHFSRVLRNKIKPHFPIPLSFFPFLSYFAAIMTQQDSQVYCGLMHLSTFLAATQRFLRWDFQSSLVSTFYRGRSSFVSVQTPAPCSRLKPYLPVQSSYVAKLYIHQRLKQVFLRPLRATYTLVCLSCGKALQQQSFYAFAKRVRCATSTVLIEYLDLT